MNQKRTFTLLALIVAVLILGIAYAAIQNVTLSIAGNVTASPDQGNFKVGFTGKYQFTGYPVETRASNKRISGSTNADTGTGTFDAIGFGGNFVSVEISNLSVKGDKATMRFEVKNSSADISAILAASAALNDHLYSGDNSTEGYEEYFKITTSIETNVLYPGKTTWLTMTIELTKTPIKENIRAGIDVSLIATPTYS